MTIEYALTRTDVVRGFFLGMSASPKYRGMILLNAGVVGALVLMERIALYRSFTLRDVLIAVAYALGVVAFMPLWLFIRAKTAKRTLTVSQDGIETEIGKIRGRVPWRKVKLVYRAGKCVIIARLGGNSFFIPDRAFTDPAHRDHFLADIDGWIKADSVSQP